MKKVLFSAMVVALAFTSCKKDDDGNVVNCAELTTTANTRATAFVNDPSTANCVAYRDSLQALVDANCTGSANIQAQIDALVCN